MKRTPQAEDLQLYVKALIELGEIQQAAYHLDGVRRQKDGLEEDLAHMVRDVVEGLEQEQPGNHDSPTAGSTELCSTATGSK